MKKNKTKYTESNDDDYFQYIEVEYKINNIFEEHYESNTYIQEIKGDVFLIDDSNGSKEKVGEIFLYLVDMKGQYIDGFDYEDMLDGHSMEFTNYVNDFFDLDEGFIKPQFSNDDLFDNPDILIIHTVILNESARKKGFGLRVIKNIEFVFGKDKLIIVRPFPIQFGGVGKDTIEVKKFDLDLLPKNETMMNVYAKKIAKTYSKIGYKKDKKSDLMFKPNQQIY
jgi:hypothetical protein